ncbi:MAG: Rpn family recombination-promoting nuclease/putative transposase, partial [Defluviitaleaceae bacterium]|nr:Rpn family recombination-promoting nuclease/putative transposase [Defluviitaleaceae bacterium]
MKKSTVRAKHSDTMFRGIFKNPKHFVYLLKHCRGADSLVSPDEIKPFDLDSEFVIRMWRNDVSFITSEGKIIILVEHQSTINPNMAFRMLLYYTELLQLWLKAAGVNLYGGKKIENFPEPEFYVVYNGPGDLKEESSTFKLEREGIKIDVTVKIADIRFEKLHDIAAENALAGYSYFNKILEDGMANGLSKDDAFEAARQDC